jgi:hypothetical protein
VRFTVVRIWSTAAVAMLAAGTADAVVEFAANGGWLGAGLQDNQHEAIAPVLALGALTALLLLAFILFARISLRDPLLVRMGERSARWLDTISAFAGGVVSVVAMEGYETRFGGVSPFDPGSVVASHTAALFVAILAIGAVMHWMLRAAAGVASRASVAAIELFARFFPQRLNLVQPPTLVRTPAFKLGVAHVALAIAAGVRGLRAPPRSIHLRYVLA